MSKKNKFGDPRKMYVNNLVKFPINNRKDSIITFTKGNRMCILCYTEFEVTGKCRKEYLRNTVDGYTNKHEWINNFIHSLNKIVCPEMKCSFPYFWSNGNQVIFRTIWSSVFSEFQPETIECIKNYFDIPSDVKIKGC